MNKPISFIWYLITDPIKSLFIELRELWDVVTKQKIWVFIWAVVMIVTLFFKDKTNFVFATICFLIFFITYQYKKFSEIYIHREREKLKEKIGFNPFKKRKDEPKTNK
jgi:hypothetical protein